LQACKPMYTHCYFCHCQEVKECAGVEEGVGESTFSDVYHALIHSPALETLLNLEHTYALAIDELIQQRDKDLQHMQQQ